MFPVTITIANAAQLNAVMAALSVEAQAPVAAPVEAAAAPSGKSKATTAKPATPPAPSSPTAEVAVAAAPAPSTEPPAPPTATAAPAAASSAGEPATYQDAATAITKLSRTKGRDAAVAVLKKFGAAKLPDVKPEQFADVIAAAEAAMKE